MLLLVLGRRRRLAFKIEIIRRCAHGRVRYRVARLTGRQTGKHGCLRLLLRWHRRRRLTLV